MVFVRVKAPFFIGKTKARCYASRLKNLAFPIQLFYGSVCPSDKGICHLIKLAFMVKALIKIINGTDNPNLIKRVESIGDRLSHGSGGNSRGMKRLVTDG